MSELSQKTVLVFDHGLGLPIAERLARDFGRVLYFSEWQTGFSTINAAVIGDGIPNVERCYDIWDIKKEVDLWVFCDIQHSGLQLELEKQGFRVWGSRKADQLETNRQLFLRTLKELGLDVPKFQICNGITELREVLKDKEDCFVKISKYRGSLETKHWRNWRLDENLLDLWAVRFGAVREKIPFLVFDNIDTPLEIGGDTYCIDGQWSDLMLHGIEWKDQAYFASVTPKQEMPDQIQTVLEAFGPLLKNYRYRNEWSMELRVKGDKFYFIDPTCYSADTEVLTGQGWCRFDQLENDNNICTLNPATGEIEYHWIEATCSYQFEGEMVSISSPKRTVDLLVTPNHSVWSIKHGKSSLVEERADSVRHTGVIPRTGKWRAPDQQVFVVPEYRKRWHSGKGKGIWREHTDPAKEIGMDLWLKFMAMFLAEGCVHSHQVEITQTKYKKSFREVLRQLPFSFSEHKTGFTLHSIQLADCLKDTGLRHERRIPTWIFRLSARQIRLFLDFYMMSDGSCGEHFATTTSRGTADDLQILFLLAGSVADINVLQKAGQPVKISDGKYVTKHDSIQVYERRVKQHFYYEGWNIKRQKYFKRVPYKGMVYCVQVPNHIIFVRRNGRACWSGNCRLGLPSTGSQLELWKNWSEIVWAGANGELVQPEPLGQFSAEVILHAKSDEGLWPTVEIPDDLRQWLKLADCCEIDASGLRAWPREGSDEDSVGWLVAIGDTPQQTLDNLKDHISKLPDGLTGDCSPIAEIIKEIQVEEQRGIEFTDQKMPQPKAVLE